MKFGKYKIDDKLIIEYIKHFDASKEDLGSWETKRGELHAGLFDSVNVKRFSEEGNKLSKEIDKYCIPLLEKSDYIVAGLKKIGMAKNEGELQIASMDLQNKHMFAELQRRRIEGERELKEKTYTGHCRVCDKDVSAGGGRVNDHLMTDGLDSTQVSDPICMDCVKNNPDEHFSEFREKYWSH